MAKLKSRGKPFKKGQGGRPKGVPNKLSKSIRDSILEAFNELQIDKQYNILSWAKENTTEFYKIASKLIPVEVAANVDVNRNVSEVTVFSLKLKGKTQ